jgi:hypothetical protein
VIKCHPTRNAELNECRRKEAGNSEENADGDDDGRVEDLEWEPDEAGDRVEGSGFNEDTRKGSIGLRCTEEAAAKLSHLVPMGEKPIYDEGGCDGIEEY